MATGKYFPNRQTTHGFFWQTLFDSSIYLTKLYKKSDLQRLQPPRFSYTGLHSTLLITAFWFEKPFFEKRGLFCFFTRVKRLSPLIFVVLSSTLFYCKSSRPGAHGADTPTVVASVSCEVNEVQREGIPFTIVNTSDGAGAYEWTITASDTEKKVLTSDDRDLQLRLPRGAYDVLLRVKGINTLERHFRRKITVLPAVFNERSADTVILLSTLTDRLTRLNFSKSSKPGYKILLKGHYRGKLVVTGLRGSKADPVHILNSGKVVIEADEPSQPYPLIFADDCTYVLLDGLGEPALSHGITVIGHPRRAGQCVFVAGDFNRGFEICGLHVIGQQGKTSGAAAIQVQPSSSMECNATNWSFDYFYSHHNKIEQATTEGYYIGYFTDAIQESGFRPYRMGRVLIYRNTIEHSGWDGIQVGGADELEIHDNYINYFSLGKKAWQNSSISWNNGNKRGWIYRNKIMNGAQGFSGGTGDTDSRFYIYSNLMVQGSYPKESGSSTFMFIKIDSTAGSPAIHFFHNTIHAQNVILAINHVRPQQSACDSLTFAGNLIVSDSIFDKPADGLRLSKAPKVQEHWLIHNLRMLPQQLNAAGINDKVLMPSASGAEIFTLPASVQKQLPDVRGGHFDVDGYPLRRQAADSVATPYGCYSGYANFIKQSF